MMMMCLCLANEEKITSGARSPAADRGRRSSSGTDDHGGDIAHLNAGVPSTPERPVDDGDLAGTPRHHVLSSANSRVQTPLVQKQAAPVTPRATPAIRAAGTERKVKRRKR
ncbi:hypothetical protein GQ55_1G308800 [Panicum hallii var. hallii]|uniref:Uncharacterized protein n=1 Tax=Panicum hallii var. hallii TaxID=1504633 RepID=A0A2T7F992_9POAL|nr:hypothetical protein GQ55_1G308800 [Panicum hallii var. hallii]